MFNLNTSISTSKTVAIASFATLLLSGITAQTAMAETKADSKVVVAAASADPEFAKLDANGNGKISLKEAAKDKGVASVFDAIDANKDGDISAEEHAAYKAASAAPAAAPVAEPAPAK